MGLPWDKVAAVGSLITFLAVAPYFLAMVGIAMNLNTRTADPQMLVEMTKLSVRMLVAMVPLSIGGVVLFAFFQFAEERV